MALVVATAAALTAGRLAGLAGVAGVQTFVLIFTSIVVQALPFVVVGALVSAAIEVYLSDRAMTRVTRLPMAAQLPAAAFGGLAFPVCECGSVPVARRLIARGVHPAAAVAFMLASSIFNPIVLVSTFIAYRALDLGWEMAIGRAAMGLIVSTAAGWALGADGAWDLLRRRPGEDEQPHHDGARGRAFVDHLAGDVVFMGRFLVAGAALAASVQTIVPQSIVSGIARTPILGSLALMAIAFVLSLCSEADAFVAVSFTQFPLSAQLAFLVFGPALDMKLAFLYGATFRKRFVLRLAAIAIPLVLAGSLWFQVAFT
jgi:uncharacterized membrane protein YraQ (UPF0718 family)